MLISYNTRTADCRTYSIRVSQILAFCFTFLLPKHLQTWDDTSDEDKTLTYEADSNIFLCMGDGTTDNIGQTTNLMNYSSKSWDIVKFR